MVWIGILLETCDEQRKQLFVDFNRQFYSAERESKEVAKELAASR